MADTLVLGTSAERREGSTPSWSTKQTPQGICEQTCVIKLYVLFNFGMVVQQVEQLIVDQQVASSSLVHSAKFGAGYWVYRMSLARTTAEFDSL